MKTIVEILLVLIQLATLVIFVQVIMSLLLSFNVINTYNDFVRSLWLALKRVTDPIYTPIRRVLPDFGGIDFSPLVVLLILQVLGRIVLPNFLAWYMGYGTL